MQIFISYCKSDASFQAEELARILGAAGWSVWFDNQIEPGYVWDEKIKAELAAAGCVLGLWSKGAVASKWVNFEFDDAAKRGVLIPVVTDDEMLPEKYLVRQAVDLREYQKFSGSPRLRRMISAMLALVGAPVSGRLRGVVDINLIMEHLQPSWFSYYRIGKITIPATIIASSFEKPYEYCETVVNDRGDYVHDREGYPAALNEIHPVIFERMVKNYGLNLLKLKDNPLVRLDSVEQEGEDALDERGRLILNFSRTTYFRSWSNNVGCRESYEPPGGGDVTSIIEEFCAPPYEDLDNSVLANAVGVEAVVISDSPDQSPRMQVIVNQRGRNVAGYRGWYQSSASGHFSDRHVDETGKISPFASAIIETRQEISSMLNLSPCDYKMLGVVFKEYHLYPSIFGFIKTSRRADVLVGDPCRDKFA